MDKCYNRKGSGWKSKNSRTVPGRGSGGTEAVWVSITLTLTAGVCQPYAAKLCPVISIKDEGSRPAGWLALGIVGGIALPSSSFLRRFAP